jgi:hypothetical protein
MMGLYFISRFISELPKPGFISILCVIGGVMIALNTRAGGLLLLVYLFLFSFISILGKYNRKELSGSRPLWASAIYIMITGLCAYNSWNPFLALCFIQPYYQSY